MNAQHIHICQKDGPTARASEINRSFLSPLFLSKILYENHPPKKRLIVFCPFAIPRKLLALNLKSLTRDSSQFTVTLADALFRFYH